MIRTKLLIRAALSLSVFFSISTFAQEACDKAEIFKPIVGQWRAYLTDEVEIIYAGRLNTELVFQGCGLKQKFIADNTSLINNHNFESLGFVAPNGNWHEVSVSSDGMVRHYHWQRNEEELILVFKTSSATERIRLVLFNFEENEYQLIEERSQDRGDSWISQKSMLFIREHADSKTGI